MTDAQQRFAIAYLNWKLRYAPDIEPDPLSFGLSEEQGEAIALRLHQEIEAERIKAVLKYKPKT